MKTTIYFCLAALCLVTGRGFTDERAPLTAPIGARLIQTAPAGARDMSLLHSWENTQILGFNAQGRLLVYAAARQRFEAHDLAATNAAVIGWQNPDGGPHASGAFSPDGRTLATVSAAGKDQSRIRLWNSFTGEQLGPAFAPTDVAHLAFSADGKSLAGVVSRNGTVRIWDVISGELRSSMSLPDPSQAGWSGIQFSPDGHYVAARCRFTWLVWNVAKRKPAVDSPYMDLYLAISPDWKFALRPGRFVDFADPGAPTPAPRPLASQVQRAKNGVFSPDGRLMAMSMLGNRLRIWDATTQRMVASTTTNVGFVVQLAFSPDNRIVLSSQQAPNGGGYYSGSVQLWNPATGRPWGPPRSIPGLPLDSWFDRDGRFFVMSFAQGDNSFGVQVGKLPSGLPPPAQAEEMTAPQPTPIADSIDVRGVGFKTPECVLWDKAADLYLVSNIHGHPLDKDDNGFISRVRPDGTVDALKWIDGADKDVTLHAPKGMAIMRDTLWVADIDVVRQFDLKTGKPLGEIVVKGASYLNDVTFAGGDGEGQQQNTHILVTDTGLERDGETGLKPNGKPRFVIIDTANGQVTMQTMAELKNDFRQHRTSNVFGPIDQTAEADDYRRFNSDQPYGMPNGIAFLGLGHVIVTWDTGFLYTLSAHDRGGMTDGYKLPKGQLDGVVSWSHRDPVDQQWSGGGFLVSSWEGQCVYEMRAGPPSGPLAGSGITELVKGIRAPADLDYDAKRNRVLIPLFLDDTLLIRPGPKPTLE